MKKLFALVLALMLALSCMSAFAQTYYARLSVDRDVADPWYTGDFETTYADVVAGCAALLKTIGEPKL